MTDAPMTSFAQLKELAGTSAELANDLRKHATYRAAEANADLPMTGSDVRAESFLEWKAADTILALINRVEELEKGLEECATVIDDISDPSIVNPSASVCHLWARCIEASRRARSLLGGKS